MNGSFCYLCEKLWIDCQCKPDSAFDPGEALRIRRERNQESSCAAYQGHQFRKRDIIIEFSMRHYPKDGDFTIHVALANQSVQIINGETFILPARVRERDDNHQPTS